MRPRTLAALAIVSSVAASSAAHGATPGASSAEPAAAAAHDRGYDFSAGLKVLLGGSLWTTPTDTLSNKGVPWGWDGNGGGFAWGAGAYGEVRFLRYLGVEVDLFHDSTTLQRDLDWTLNGVAKFKLNEKVEISSWRLPVLLKATVPSPGARPWIGFGPEFVLSSSVSPSLAFTSGAEQISATQRASVEGFAHADTATSTRLLMALGIVIDLPAELELPIELRASKSGQSSSWPSRVDYTATTSSYTAHVESTWDFRLGVGLGRKF